ncbi:MAG: hypothetical protein AAGB12_05880 [Pseudomonadota bacterium]
MNKLSINILSSLIAISILLLALSLLWAYQFFKKTNSDQVLVRTIETLHIKAPPPPPPPMTLQQQQALSIELNVTGSGPGLDIMLTPPDIDIPDLAPPVLTMQQKTEFNLDLTIDWQALTLGELDATPRLISKLDAPFPKAIRGSDLEKLDILLDVLIDEQGQVTLVNILKNPLPESIPYIKSFVAAARFTEPKKDGISVRARFNWPVEFDLQ